jgi:hypothetical protein
LNTKQAKDFLVRQTDEQAALENVSLSDIEKKMMYFTESDPASCENPLELNDEFEAKYDTAEYEAKISGLLHHAYDKLKTADPENKRVWDQAVRELRKRDHYFLVLWDIELPSDHPTRDFFKLLGIGMLIAVGIGIAILVAVIYKIDLEPYRKYLLFVFIGFLLIASGFLRSLFRLAVVWFHKRTTKDNYSN